MSASIVIDGFTLDDKVPGFVSQRTFGGGKQSIGSIPLKCVAFGNKTSGGTAALNSMTQATSPAQAASLWGARSELARMAYAAFEEGGSGVAFHGVVVDEASGGAAATATVTFTGTTATSGVVTFQFDEQIFVVNFQASDTSPTLRAVAFVTAFNALQDGNFFATAANSSGVVTVTCANVGLRGNQHTAWVVDTSAQPASNTVVITGGTALANGGIPFTGGTGADDITAALNATDGVQLDFLAVAQNDSTNLGVVESHVAAKAAFDVGLLDTYVVAGNGTQSASLALAQTQMNDALGQFVWAPLGVEHPSRTAARMAAVRSITEGAQPNTNYNGRQFKKAPPNYRVQDSPSRATKKTALNSGMTILETVNGKLTIVRAICSHSLNGSTPDYRVLDVSNVAVPIRITKELGAAYAAMLVDMPFAGPDVSDDQLPPKGVLTPRIWAHEVTALMTLWSSGDFNWVTAVDDNPTVAQWDSDAQRIMSSTPVIVRAHNNQLGAKINQIAA